MTMLTSFLFRAPSRRGKAALWAAVFVCCLALGVQIASAENGPSAYWSDVSESSIAPAGERQIVPNAYRTVSLQMGSLLLELAHAPMERTPEAVTGRITIDLPMPDGSIGQFMVVESPIMHPDLAAQFPEIKTYAGQGIDDPTAALRFSITPFGFHGMILSGNGTFYIDPYQRYDTDHYISYYRSDFNPAYAHAGTGGCELVDDEELGRELAELIAGGAAERSGDRLRTYRLCTAATGEYTTYHGGTVALGQAAIVVAINRVTGIYERDMSVRLELIPNNSTVVYTNAATDPYTNNNGSTMLGQNQSNLDSVIGDANYDMGHVFSTGGGGIAYLGCVCRSGLKARGVTGLPSPIGDPFYVDYVAHEMGHQFGAYHTFNGNAGGCAGNRTASSAYEPGSGSTIMAYAGLCSPQNLQYVSDDYFHSKSWDSIIAYTTTSYGNNCPALTSTGNNAPVVNAGITGKVVPINTPLQLVGSATDPDGDESLTYCWEERDLGAAGHPDSPVGNAPIFRSFDPKTEPFRVFPKESNLVNNSHYIGELLPTYARNLNFRLTVRDNQILGGGVDYASVAFTTAAAAGPFLVTNPNDTGIVWGAGATKFVQWDVAGTTANGVNTAQVNILLSTDGGYTWPITLATATLNDGSAPITVPSIVTTTARVKVEAVDNIFFDISDRNFEIEDSSDIDELPLATVGRGLQLYASQPNPFTQSTAISFDLFETMPVRLAIYDPAGRSIKTLVSRTLEAGPHTVTWDGTDSHGNAVASGVYLYKVEAGGESRTLRLTHLK